MTSGCLIPKALEDLDLEVVVKHFDGMTKTRRTDQDQPKHDDSKPDSKKERKQIKEQDPDKTSKKEGKQDKLTEFVLIGEESATEFVVGLVDEALQLRVQSMSSAQDFEGVAGDLATDAMRVQEHLHNALPATADGVLSFQQVLRAIITVLKCSSTSPAPPPSEARAARHVVKEASTAKDSFKVARAMKLHGGKRAMERARREAAIGMADDAADLQFQALFDGLESSLAVAFDESVLEFAMSAGGEGPGHTIATFGKFFDVAHGAAVEFQMVLKAWSTSRLEQKLSDAATVIQALLFIARVGTFVGARAFEVDIPQLPTLARARATAIDDGASGGGETTSAGETVADGGVVQLQLQGPSTQAGAAFGQAENIIDKSSLVVIQAIAEKIPEFRTAIAAHMERVADTLSIVKTLDEMLRGKLHEKYDKELEELNVDLPEAEHELSQNNEAFEMIICFMENLVAIAPVPPLAESMDLTTTALNHEGYLQSLSGFCSAYRHIHEDDSLIQVRIGGDCQTLLENTSIATIVKSILTEYGKMLYEAHSSPIAGVLIKGLTNMTIQVQVCEASTIQNHNRLDALLLVFLSAPTPEVLAAPAGTMPGLDMDSEKFFSRAPQHVLFSNLEVVCTALDIGTMLVTGLRKPGCKTDEPVVAERALTYLKVVSHVRDVAAIASVMHLKLCVPLTAQETLDEKLVMDELPHWLAHLGHGLTVLDALLLSSEVTSMESEGWVHPVPFAVARNFAVLVAHFRCRCILALLDLWAKLLDNFASQTVAVCPQLGVCLTSNSLDEPLAQKMITGKLGGVVKSHNFLHSQLHRLTTSTNRMSLSPRLQDHPSTKAAVSIALHAMGLAKSCSTIARGLQLLDQVRHEQDGPQQIKQFLKNFPES